MIWSKKPSHATVPLKQPSFKMGSTQTTTYPILFFKSLCLGTLTEETIYMLQEENTRRAFCKPKQQRARLNNVVLEQSSREREGERVRRADKGSQFLEVETK
jgi:hypothetical protein